MLLSTYYTVLAVVVYHLIYTDRIGTLSHAVPHGEHIAYQTIIVMRAIHIVVDYGYCQRERSEPEPLAEITAVLGRSNEAYV